MELHGYLVMLRRQWLLVAVVLGLAIATSAIFTLRQTPLYSSQVTFFVTTPFGDNTSAAYTGGLFSQQRVKSYVDLLRGDRLATAVLQDARVSMTPAQLQKEISASSKPDTVLLTATVTDPSPQRAQLLAAAIGRQFAKLVAELETPAGAQAPVLKVQVVESPQLPTSPVSPRPARNLGLAGLVGLLLGFGLALLRETLDTSIKDSETLRGITQAPNLAVVPFDAAARRAPLVVQDRGHSVRAESFRQLRTNLQFVDVDRPPRVVVVTSALPGEGKSTTAANLAITVAEAGSRVILVEGDLRRPKVVDYLGLEGAVGLTDVLVGRVDLPDVVQPWGPHNLVVLPSGSIPPNPSELLTSQNMTDLLDRLAGQYELVLVDAPPLLPVADGAILAGKADGALLVLRHGKTTGGQAEGAVAALRAVDARLLGSVITMAPAKGPGSYAYGYAYRYDEAHPSRPHLGHSATVAPMTVRRHAAMSRRRSSG
ncbi:MAG: polysaccharide biosynthesis tyrosine autokinase [Actinomycetota bacterium]